MTSTAARHPFPLDSVPLVPSRLDLTLALELVADTIVESLGFDVAVINVVHDDDTMLVAAVCGPEEVKAALLNRRQGREGWAALLASSEPWGRLRFVDHRAGAVLPADLLTWVSTQPPSEDPNAWHPLDSLFAPLEATDGTLLGMLSVDVPRDGLRPSAATRHALEAFAVAAALALEHATLAAQSRGSLRQFQAVFNSSPVAIGLMGQDRVFLSANDALCAFLARPREQIVGHRPAEFSHPDDRELSAAVLDAVWPPGPEAARSPVEPLEKRYLHPDGSTVWGRLHVAAVERDLDLGTDPAVVGPAGDGAGLLIAQVEDITERKRTEQRLELQANHDSLTGLPNRHASMRALRRALDADTAEGTMTAVFFCDLDRLKLINDAHGHAVGDAYLRAVSQRIRGAVRDTDTVGRLSGDEFVVVVTGLRWAAEALGLAGRIIDAVRAPLTLAGTPFSPSLSLGVAYNEGFLGADELLAQADAAMYQAKLEDRGSWHVYDSTLRGSAAAHLLLRNDVSGALERGELVLHYQPIVRLVDEVVIGHEALLRWQHPALGLLAPAEFLDVILDSEFESPVTDWVLQQACRDAASRPVGARRVNVNVSSLQVGRRDLPQVLRRCLADSGLDPSDLVLELTEDRLLSRPDGACLLDALHEVGVGLAIDDFGTGFAGLGYLQRFSAINVVKLDRSFITGLGVDPVSEHIVSAVADLARKCGFRLVTEGVETPEQAHLLSALGVEYAQGYLFGKPAPHHLLQVPPQPAPPPCPSQVRRTQQDTSARGTATTGRVTT
jgi:diguanylate cyclase (GGDEF)-like protein/PAS domain S-box-containing protein